MTVALIADDHEMPRAALRVLLADRMGFDRVVEAASLNEAFDALDAEPAVTIALFDLDMPGTDGGFAGMQALRSLYPALKVAVVSGSSRRQDMLDALGAGLHGFVPKSLRLDEMEAAFRWILSGNVYAPAALAVPPPPELRAAASPVELSGRQREVLHQLRLGRSNKEIARALGLGLGTVKVHVAALLRSLGASGRTEAVAVASERGVP